MTFKTARKGQLRIFFFLKKQNFLYPVRPSFTLLNQKQLKQLNSNLNPKYHAGKALVINPSENKKSTTGRPSTPLRIEPKYHCINIHGNFTFTEVGSPRNHIITNTGKYITHVNNQSDLRNYKESNTENSKAQSEAPPKNEKHTLDRPWAFLKIEIKYRLCKH